MNALIRLLTAFVSTAIIVTSALTATAQYYVTIANQTSYTLTYNLNGQNVQLVSGQNYTHTKTTPGFNIFFDSDLSPATVNQHYVLRDNSINRFAVVNNQLGLYCIGPPQVQQQIQPLQGPIVQSREQD